MHPTSIVNGQPSDTISILDRGLLYGDALFETIALVDGQALLIEQHIERLQNSAKHLGFNIDTTILLNDIALLTKAHQGQNVLRVTLTRGVGGRGYMPDAAMACTRIVSLHDWPDYPDHYKTNGVNLSVSDVMLSTQPLLAGLKHSNRLEQVLAAQNIPSDCQDVVMLDNSLQVVECSKANIFVMVNNQWLTPQLNNSGVEGIMRNAILELASDLGISIKVSTISTKTMETATAAFICNSISGIWPVKRYKQQCYSIHNQCLTLQQELHNRDYCA